MERPNDRLENRLAELAWVKVAQLGIPDKGVVAAYYLGNLGALLLRGTFKAKQLEAFLELLND